MKFLLLALALSSITAAPRQVCTHGCQSKYCKKATCGNTCKAHTCHGCWKD